MFSSQKTQPSLNLNTTYMTFNTISLEYTSPACEDKSTEEKSECVGVVAQANKYIIGWGLETLLKQTKDQPEAILPNVVFSTSGDKKTLLETAATLGAGLGYNDQEVYLIKADKSIKEIIEKNDPKLIYDFIDNAQKTFKKKMGQSFTGYIPVMAAPASDLSESNTPRP